MPFPCSQKIVKQCDASCRDIVQHANSIVLVMDPVGRITFLNEFAKFFFGFNELELLGSSVIGTIVPEQESSGRDLAELIRNICTDPDQYSANENENITKSGNLVSIAWTNSAIRDEQGQVRSIVCVGNDVTALRKSEIKKRREVDNRYDRLLCAVTDYIYTVILMEGKTVHTEHGPACEAVTGYTPDEYRNDPVLWNRMIVAEDKDAVLRHVAAVLDGITTAPIEHRIVHKDRSIRWVKNTIVPHFNAQGKISSYDGLVADITERKSIEEQLYQAQKMEALGRLAGGVVHDLNNYLCVIIGQMELLQMKTRTSPDDPMHARLDLVRVSAQKAADVSQQLLAFSRKQVAEPRVLNVNDTIQGMTKVLHRLLGENAALDLDLSKEFCHIRADRTQIEQVLVNLVVNARDAMPFFGEVRIATSHVEIGSENRHQHLNIEPGRYIRICVEDTGIGMSDHVKQRIFDPFFTTKEKGTGLGLSTVYGIVKQSGGQIKLESEEGTGSAFRIYFPATYDIPKDKAEQKTSLVASPCNKETILVIDDDEPIRRMTMDMLERGGYRVLSACHGQDALSVLERHGGPVDLVISDVAMPRMNGPEFSRKLAERHADSKMIFMTGHIDNNASLYDHGLKEHNVKFLSKPFNRSTLLTRVREVMEQ